MIRVYDLELRVLLHRVVHGHCAECLEFGAQAVALGPVQAVAVLGDEVRRKLDAGDLAFQFTHAGKLGQWQLAATNQGCGNYEAARLRIRHTVNA